MTAKEDRYLGAIHQAPSPIAKSVCMASGHKYVSPNKTNTYLHSKYWCTHWKDGGTRRSRAEVHWSFRSTRYSIVWQQKTVTLNANPVKIAIDFSVLVALARNMLSELPPEKASMMSLKKSSNLMTNEAHNCISNHTNHCYTAYAQLPGVPDGEKDSC